MSNTLVLMKGVHSILVLCQLKKPDHRGANCKSLLCTDQTLDLFFFFSDLFFIQYFRSYSCSYVFKVLEIMIFVFHLCCSLANKLSPKDPELSVLIDVFYSEYTRQIVANSFPLSCEFIGQKFSYLSCWF